MRCQKKILPNCNAVVKILFASIKRKTFPEKLVKAKNKRQNKSNISLEESYGTGQ
ncbi:MAG: hypothetical protein JWQ40_1693 [Segetibacter sp.]|jgi:hypothetical protein|nr:hypothetical protein [Segetibacter sp.]